MPEIFLSYRRDDAAGYAGRLRESLEERLGAGRVFRDVDTLSPGQDFVAAITDRLEQCRAFLALIGREWLVASESENQPRLFRPGDFVRREIAAALKRPDLLIIPVLVEGMTMPEAHELPTEIAALARRHAVSLRDETWDHDVDRLAAAISRVLAPKTRATSPPPEPAPDTPPARRRRTPVLLALAAVAVLAFGIVLPRLAGGERSDPPEPARSPGDSARTPARDTLPPLPAGTTHRIAMPAVAEIELGEQIYTFLWGSLTPAGQTNILRLRLRYSNEGRFPAPFGGEVFQLEMDRARIAPRAATPVVVPAHTLEAGEVAFDVPARARYVTVVVVAGDEEGSVPLDLLPVAPLAAADTADPGDALSRAVMQPLPFETPLTLLDVADALYTLERASVRRFANKLRLVFSVRFTNRQARPYNLAMDALRLLVDRVPRGPVSGEGVTVEPNTSQSAEFVFEVPPGTERALLGVFHGALPPAELPFELPRR